MIRLIAFLLCVPFAVIAEPVTIRSGEHETFSRFVITIGEGTRWSVERTEGGFLLELTNRADGFDTSTVFDRIPRERVLNVSQKTPNALFFAVDCACIADAFLWRADQLVVDIVNDPNPAETTVADAEIATFESLEITLQNQALEVPADAPQQFPNFLALQVGTESFPPMMLAESSSEVIALEDASPTPPAIDMEEMSELKATESALIEGLARAASQGFLDAAIVAPPILEPTPVPDTSVEDEAPLPVAPMIPQQPGIGITTALDRELMIVRSILGAEIGQQCLSNDLFELSDWADERPFHTQVAGLAEALAGEFGEQPLEAQNQLARLYLHYGFGTEARMILAADPAQSQDRTVLAQLAGMIDEFEDDYTLIAAQKGCDTAGAMWAFFANPEDLDDEAKNHIIQTFFGLPQPLRGQIAPRLSRRFIEIGRVDAAERLLRATDTGDTAANHETASARALIAEEMDQPDVAIAVLAEQADDNARMTPASLIRLIELGVENDHLPQDSDLILAAALRQEHRGTETADRLAIAEAAGHTQLGQFEAAFDLLANREDQIALAAINDTATQMTNTTEPAVFLGFAFGGLPDGLTSQTENLIAARLADLGFPDRAASMLSGPAERDAAAERRYLRASLAIDTGDYSGAIDGMMGIETSRANDIRLQAYAGMGEFSSALSVRPADAQDAEDSALQFRAGAWDRLTENDDEVLSTFAEAILAPPAETPAETLADRREILAQSQDSRRAVEALLLRFDGTTSQD